MVAVQGEHGLRELYTMSLMASNTLDDQGGRVEHTVKLRVRAVLYPSLLSPVQTRACRRRCRPLSIVVLRVSMDLGSSQEEGCASCSSALLRPLVLEPSCSRM